MTYKCSVWVPAIPLPTHLQLLSPLTAFPPTAEASLLSFGPPGMFPLHSAYFSFQWTSTLFHPFSSLYKRHWLRGFPWPFLIKSNSRVHHQTYTPIPSLFSFILQGTTWQYVYNAFLPLCPQECKLHGGSLVYTYYPEQGLAYSTQ